MNRYLRKPNLKSPDLCDVYDRQYFNADGEPLLVLIAATDEEATEYCWNAPMPKAA